MIFVVSQPAKVAPSALLRGQHIADVVGAQCLFQNIGGARQQKVVFVKEADRALVLQAKERGNEIIYDVIDYYCYTSHIDGSDRRCSFADLVDVLIVQNEACIDFYRADFVNARFVVIPHQWDKRITGEAPQDVVRAAFIGRGFNKPADWDGVCVKKPEEMLAAAPRYNLHICTGRRDVKSALLKPATKVATAAAVGAVAVTYRDPSAVELLGADYPYYIRTSVVGAVEYAKATFGGAIWKRALSKMREVKQKTSLEAVAALYARLEQGDLEKAA